LTPPPGLRPGPRQLVGLPGPPGPRGGPSPPPQHPHSRDTAAGPLASPGAGRAVSFAVAVRGGVGGVPGLLDAGRAALRGRRPARPGAGLPVGAAAQVQATSPAQTAPCAWPDLKVADGPRFQTAR